MLPVLPLEDGNTGPNSGTGRSDGFGIVFSQPATLFDVEFVIVKY